MLFNKLLICGGPVRMARASSSDHAPAEIHTCPSFTLPSSPHKHTVNTNKQRVKTRATPTLTREQLANRRVSVTHGDGN